MFLGDVLPGFAVKAEDRIQSAFTSKNIELKANSSPESINFIVGLLQHATGVYEKNDLSPLMQHTVKGNTEDLHRAHAEYLLYQLKKLPPNNAPNAIPIDWNTPIGTPVVIAPGPVYQQDPRVKQLLNLIGERFKTKMKVMVFHASPTQLRLRAPMRVEADHDAGEKMVDAALYYQDGKFLPLTKASLTTNPELSPEKRMARKDTLGLLSATMADLFRHQRRQARKLSDLALQNYLEGIHFDIKTQEQSEYLKEWLKRNDFNDTKEGRVQHKGWLPRYFATANLQDLENLKANHLQKMSRSEKRILEQAVTREQINYHRPRQAVAPVPVEITTREHLDVVTSSFDMLFARARRLDPAIGGTIENSLHRSRLHFLSGIRTGQRGWIRMSILACERSIAAATNQADGMVQELQALAGELRAIA